MTVNGRFRLSRSAGGIEPERHVVSGGRRGLKIGPCVGQQVVDRTQGASLGAAHSDKRRPLVRPADGLFIQRQKLLLDEDHLRSTIRDREGKISSTRTRAQRDRNCACTHDPEMRGNKSRTVLEKQERSVAFRKKRLNRIRETIDVGVELVERDLRIPKENGNVLAPAARKGWFQDCVGGVDQSRPC